MLSINLFGRVKTLEEDVCRNESKVNTLQGLINDILNKNKVYNNHIQIMLEKVDVFNDNIAQVIGEVDEVQEKLDVVRSDIEDTKSDIYDIQGSEDSYEDVVSTVIIDAVRGLSDDDDVRSALDEYIESQVNQLVEEKMLALKLNALDDIIGTPES